jgi:hypothetical protein
MFFFGSLPGQAFPNPEDLSFSVASFYNRVFTIGKIIKRPRNVYQDWKEEKLIPAHFGRDFWWEYQDLFGIEELQVEGWDKLNFVEACWIILVDILRRYGYPKWKIARDAEIYFQVSEERREMFKTLLQQSKDVQRQRFKDLYAKHGQAFAREDFNKTYREIAASITFGNFDGLLLSAVYHRSPLSFLVSHNGRPLPFIEGEPFSIGDDELTDEMLTGPHLIIPFYRNIELLLFKGEFSHFSKPITKLNAVESELILALRQKKIREVNVKKSNNDEWTIRAKEKGTIDISDERSLSKLLRNKEYRSVNFTSINGTKKSFEAESVKKRKVE